MHSEEGGWKCSSAQWATGTQGASLPHLSPHFPHVRTAADNHNTPGPPPPERGRGYAFGQSEPASPGCPTYGVALAVQGEDAGWSGRGRVRGRRARVGSGEAAGVRVPRRGLRTPAAPESRCPVPLLPRPDSGRTCSRRKKKKRPVHDV